MSDSIVFDALRALVSNRCYPLVMPQNPTYPAIVYSRISSNPENVLEGGSTIDQVRIQIDCYATTYGSAKSLAEQVRTAMEQASFKGTLQFDFDDYEPDVKVYRVVQDYYIWEHR